MRRSIKAIVELACATCATWGVVLLGGFFVGFMAHAAYVAFCAGWRYS